MTSLRQSSKAIFAGGTGLVAAIMVANAINYGINVLLAKAVAPSLFGDISLMVTILLITGVLASTLQLATSVSILNPSADHENELASMRLLANRIGLAGGLLLAVASPFAAELLQVENSWALLVMAAGFPVHIQVAVERGRLQGEMRLSRMGATFLAEGAARLGTTLIVLLVMPNLLALTIALNLGFIGAYAVCNPRLGQWSWCDLSSPSGHRPIRSVGLAVVAATLLMNIDLVVAKGLFSPVEAGKFAAIALGGRIVFFASWTLQQALLPLVTHKTRNLFLLANGVVCAVLVAVAWMWSDFWVSVAFGSDFADTAPLFGPYAFGTALIAMLSAVALLRSTDGDQRPGVLLVLGAAILGPMLAPNNGSLSEFVEARQITLLGFVIVGVAIGQILTRSSQRSDSPCRRELEGACS